MTPSLRKLVLTAHITFSVSWIGAVAAFLVLSIVGLTNQDAEVVRGAYISMNLICQYIIVPLSLGALVTGLIQSLATQWGLFRHYWVVVKLLLTILSVVVLLTHQFTAMAKAVELLSGVSAQTLPRAELGGVAFVLVRASGLGMVVLLVVTTLSVYKPWGLTAYGRRKQQERRYESSRSPESPKPDIETGDGVPRGLKIFVAAGIGAVVVIMLVSMHLTGHGFHHGR